MPVLRFFIHQRMFSFFKKKPLLDKEVQDAVAAAIASVERRSTGEIRVYAESHCPLVDPVERCEQIFVQLKMHETAEQNGVLLYLAIKDRQFAIAGDKGINDKVGGKKYWEAKADQLKFYLAKGYLKDGICACVEAVGQSLIEHFPDKGLENKNELPDEIVFGK